MSDTTEKSREAAFRPVGPERGSDSGKAPPVNGGAGTGLAGPADANAGMGQSEATGAQAFEMPKGLSPADVDYVPPLIASLSVLFRLHGRPVSHAHLMAGLPVTSGTLTPAACIRAARGAGMQARVVHRPQLADISPLTLPCMLLLADERCCVLARLRGEDADVIFPETGNDTITVPLKRLAAEYMGYAIFAAPEARLDKRASEVQLIKARRWFWDTLLHFMPISGM